MTNPYEPGSAAHLLYEQQRYEDQAAISAKNVVDIPANFSGKMGAAFFVGGGFGIVRGMVDHAAIGVTLMYAVRYALICMAAIAALYAVVLGPKMAFLAVRWAMRKSIVMKSMLIGAAIATAFGVWLSVTTHEEVSRGIVRIGPIGAALGLVVGGMISLARRGRRATITR